MSTCEGVIDGHYICTLIVLEASTLAILEWQAMASRSLAAQRVKHTHDRGKLCSCRLHNGHTTAMAKSCSLALRWSEDERRSEGFRGYEVWKGGEGAVHIECILRRSGIPQQCGYGKRAVHQIGIRQESKLIRIGMISDAIAPL